MVLTQKVNIGPKIKQTLNEYSSLRNISSYLEDVVGHKNTRNQKVCVQRIISIILVEISAHHLQLKSMGGHVFKCHREYYHTL